jgi:hypothetical protein
MDVIREALGIFASTTIDVLPIVLFIFGFQALVIRQKIPNLKRLAGGLLLTVTGLALFLMGLERALFPVGRLLAEQLTDPDFIASGMDLLTWTTHDDYFWVYIFAIAIGFSTTIAEPSLLAVAMKANETSGGAIGVWGLRVAVAIGVAVGVGLGTFRIVSGAPLHYFMIFGYIVVVIQTFWAPKLIIPLAYDSGGVTTSTVTVPLVTALGLGLAEAVPGRSPMLDGFGLVAFASLFPIIAVLAYAQITVLQERWRARSRQRDAAVHSRRIISMEES